MEQERIQQAQELFGVPEEFYEEANAMVKDEEWELILAMGQGACSVQKLKEIIEKQKLAADPAYFIWSCYHRSIINKAMDTAEPAYEISSFYRRYPIFAQYEYYAYGKFPREVKERLNAWDLKVYLSIHGDNVRAKMRGEEACVHNSTFLTLEEADAFLEAHRDTIYLHACNCKSMMYDHDRPICVCISLFAGPNSEPDRGYGEHLTLEEAKKKIREFNRKGLMQNGEDYAICNCDGTCCYPLQMARTVGSQGFYPKSRYLIDWHEDECISCGKCAAICNFSAFQKGADKKVRYHRELCWGCTICAPNCPKGAIHLIPKAEKEAQK